MNLSELDKKYIWHPYTQMKNAAPVIPIVKGDGVYLIDESGNKYIDAISSWWVNTHGHANPYIAKMIYEQYPPSFDEIINELIILKKRINNIEWHFEVKFPF